MTQATAYEVRDNIAVITMQSPPVNGLGLDLRTGISEGYSKAIEDSSVQAIVIASIVPNVFCGGADITEFGTDKGFAKPDLPSLCCELEESSKPIVAAISGVALGGGLELALACDYRIALPTAQLGLPEVNLGILPGAGGTQRLPRFAGPQMAVEMIVSGKPAPAAKALAAGFVDRVYDGDGDFVEAAVAYAKELVETGAPVRNCADMTVDTSNLPENFFDGFRAAIAKKTRGFFAPEKCIQAVEAACELPLAEGLKKEGELFQECAATPQARAQQHLFFAERAANKIPGVNPKTQIRTIDKVAIIGSGTMGGGIAMNFLNAGIPVVILDLNAEALERGVGVIRKNYEITAKKGKLTEEKLEQRMGLLTATTDYADIADVDLVIEAVFERMDIKKTVFKTLDEVCKPGAILATNTSTLDVNEIAATTGRPRDVIGLHFFSPANVMPLLEVVRGEETAEDVIVTVQKLAKRIRKTPVVVGVCYGFVGNRMVDPYGREASRLLLEGAAPSQIDKALTDFGLAMGICAMSDLAGIDVGYLVRESRRDEISKDPSNGIVLDRLYEKGCYGQKTGKGLYIYEGRDRKDNPEVQEIAEAAAAELGIARREISDQEIIERTLYTLINEGVQILDEGIAYRASDIDLVYIYGYGFPVWRGGPMRYAEEIGLDTLLNTLNGYREQLGDYGEMWFKPAPLLEKLVAEGKGFSSLNR